MRLSFQTTLVYDAFELMLLDTRRPWHKHWFDLRGRLFDDSWLLKGQRRAKERLGATARILAEQVSIDALADGLEALLSIQRSEFQAWQLRDRIDPDAMLATQLLVDVLAPLQLRPGESADEVRLDNLLTSSSTTRSRDCALATSVLGAATLTADGRQTGGWTPAIAERTQTVANRLVPLEVV